MNIPFDITGGSGPLIHTPIRTMEVCPCEAVNSLSHLSLLNSVFPLVSQGEIAKKIVKDSNRLCAQQAFYISSQN